MTSLLLAALIIGKPNASDDVLANVRKAISLPEVKQDWEETVLSGTAVYNGVDSQYKLHFRPNGAFHQEIQGALGETYGYDGKTYWEIDRSGATRTLAFEDVDRVQALLLLLTDRWLDPSSRVNASVELRNPGDTGYRIRFKPRDTGVIQHVTIDTETWLPTSAEFEIGSSKTTIALSNWRPAGGIRLPFSVKVTNEGITDTLDVSSATEAADPSKSLFSMPVAAPPNFAYNTAVLPSIETKRAPTGHVLVHPLINGKDVGWFILDSGAESMVIDPETADGLNLPKVGKEAVVGVGGTVQEPFRTAANFILGPASMNAVTFVEIDLRQLSSIFGVKLAGIVGYDFFRRFIVELDLKHPVVRIFDSATFHLTNGSWSTLQFSTGNPAIYTSFEGDRQGWFRLDTGANGSVTFHAPAVERYKLLQNRDTKASNMAGVGGATESRTGKMAWFELGGKRFKDIEATFSLAKAGAFADGYLAGNIGQDLMEPFTVVFDFGGSRVAFLPH